MFSGAAFFQTRPNNNIRQLESRITSGMSSYLIRSFLSNCYYLFIYLAYCLVFTYAVLCCLYFLSCILFLCVRTERPHSLFSIDNIRVVLEYSMYSGSKVLLVLLLLLVNLVDYNFLRLKLTIYEFQVPTPRLIDQVTLCIRKLLSYVLYESVLIVTKPAYALYIISFTPILICI